MDGMPTSNNPPAPARERAVPLVQTFAAMLAQQEQAIPPRPTAETLAQVMGVVVRLPGIFAAMYDDSGTYRWVCARFGAELGIDASRLIGQRFADLFSSGWSQERLELLQETLRLGMPIPTIEIFRGRRVESLVVPVNDAQPRPAVVYMGRFAPVTRPNPGDPRYEAVRQLQHADWGPLAVLTQRELEVLRHISRGLENDEIAAAIHRTKRAVEWHIKHLYEYLGCRSRVELFRYGIEAGLVAIDDAHWARMLADRQLRGERDEAK